MRWNALAMVVRANRGAAELGGHIATYASIADLFEVGFNHFFRAGAKHGMRCVCLFPAAFLAGRLCRAWLEGGLVMRNSTTIAARPADPEPGCRHAAAALHSGPGLSSYPHPWLMPDFWQFPTGSMGLGPVMPFTRRASCAIWNTAVC